MAEVKRACVAAADQGQLLRDGGQYSEARREFTRCSGEDCPSLVQEQCATWLGQLVSSTPTVVFAASDEDGKDLTIVSVTAEGRRVVDRLDGRPVEFDPGPHEIRFEAPGHGTAVVHVVLRAGDKNRAIRASLPDLRVRDVRRDSAQTPASATPPTSFWNARSLASFSLLAVGALSAATGGSFAVLSRNEAGDAAGLRQGLGPSGCGKMSAAACLSLSDAVNLQRQDFVASSIFYAVSAAFAVSAVTTWIVWPRTADGSASVAAFVLRPTLGPESAGLRAELALR